jgi:hypothetical protein
LSDFSGKLVVYMVTIIKLREVKKVTKNIEEIFRTLTPGQERAGRRDDFQVVGGLQLDIPGI